MTTEFPTPAQGYKNKPFVLPPIATFPKTAYNILMNIQEQFNAVAKEYDENRQKFIPCFNDFYITSTDFAAKSLAKK